MGPNIQINWTEFDYFGISETFRGKRHIIKKAGSKEPFGGIPKLRKELERYKKEASPTDPLVYEIVGVKNGISIQIH